LGRIAEVKKAVKAASAKRYGDLLKYKQQIKDATREIEAQKVKVKSNVWRGFLSTLNSNVQNILQNHFNLA